MTTSTRWLIELRVDAPLHAFPHRSRSRLQAQNGLTDIYERFKHELKSAHIAPRVRIRRINRDTHEVAADIRDDDFAETVAVLRGFRTVRSLKVDYSVFDE